MKMLDKFRDAAAKKGMSGEDIDWWLRLARPYLALRSNGDGPVVGYFGGRPALPATVTWPKSMSHLASIDLAALPPGGTDLDLPADGTLMFFAMPDMTGYSGRVVYVPAGDMVTEMAPPDGYGYDEHDRYALYATVDHSLPEDPSESAVYLNGKPRDDERLFEQIMWDISSPGASLVLGGYGSSNTGGLGVPVDADEEEVLLAEFYLDDLSVDGEFQTELATLYYVTTSDVLAARDFDRVAMSMDFLG